MTKKIYLETFKKYPGSFCFPLLALVGLNPMKSLSSVSLSVHLFVTKFSQDWIIIFSDIVHDDS